MFFKHQAEICNREEAHTQRLIGGVQGRPISVQVAGTAGGTGAAHTTGGVGDRRRSPADQRAADAGDAREVECPDI